ncbi:MAG TPA: transporter substrate-binding domain-containing protein [Alphaproteobacteria bacterium]|nr:transporter substrate-binding domain-containing protein [Alphaproteobacteria bacterium]
MLRILALLPLLLGSPAVGAIELVTGTDYAPYAADSALAGGMATEIVATVFADLGDPARITYAGWQRGLQKVLEGEFAGTFPYTPLPEREAVFLYSAPLVTTRNVVFSRTAAPVRFEGPADLRGLRLCLPAGYAAPKPLLPMIESGAILRVPANDLPVCARMVADGRADFFAIDELVGRRAAQQAGLPDGTLSAGGTPLLINTLHLIVPRADILADSRIAAFNAGLERLKASGRYDGIVARHREQFLASAAP